VKTGTNEVQTIGMCFNWKFEGGGFPGTPKIDLGTF